MSERDPDTSLPFVPLSSREAGDDQPRGPVEGVPDYLLSPLIAWFNNAVDLEQGLLGRVKLRLRATDIGKEDILDATDALLYLLLPRAEEDEEWAARFPNNRYDGSYGPTGDRLLAVLQRIDQILEDGGSVYRVTSQPGGLQRRVARSEARASDLVITDARSSARPAAADDLEAAWRAAYGLHPNPSEAYRLSIRAVEHAAAHIVVPRAPKPTLGTIRAALRDSPAKWHVALGGESDDEVMHLVNQISLLYSGQIDRHGGAFNFAEVTQRQAEEAVHQAILLVRYFSTGIVTMRTTD